MDAITDEQELIKSLAADLRWIENGAELSILTASQLAKLTIRIGTFKMRLAFLRTPETLDSLTIKEVKSDGKGGYYINCVYTTIDSEELKSVVFFVN